MRRIHIILISACIIFMSHLSAPEKQGALSVISKSKAGVGYGVYVYEDYAYITNNEGVTVFDVQKPVRPRKTAEIRTGVTRNICVKDGLAYIGCEYGLVIADIKDPTSPRQLGECDCYGIPNRVSVCGSYAYIASSKGLEIVDVNDPYRLKYTGHYACAEAWGVDVYECITYLASPLNGLELIDVTDPVYPKKLTTVPGTEGSWDVQVHEKLAYLGCHGAGIKIVSLSDKKQPQIIGQFHDDDGGEAMGVWCDGEYLFIADNFGIEVLYASDPTNLYEICEYSKVKGAHDLFIYGNHVYVAEARKGLIILEFSKEQRN